MTPRQFDCTLFQAGKHQKKFENPKPTILCSYHAIKQALDIYQQLGCPSSQVLDEVCPTDIEHHPIERLFFTPEVFR
jgi:hypothetical protein